MANVIKSMARGTRRVAGTDFTIVDRVERRQYGIRVEWVVVRGLCNGVPDTTEVYRTRAQALRCLAEAPADVLCS